MAAHETSRFFFDNVGAAALGLKTVLEHARTSKEYYRFSPLDARGIFASGLLVSGDIGELAAMLDEIPGSVRYDE